MQARTEGLPSLYRTQGGAQDDEVVRRSQRGVHARARRDARVDARSRRTSRSSSRCSRDRKRRIWFAGGRFSQLVATYLCLQLRMLRPGCAMVARRRDRRVLDSLEVSRRDVLCLFDYRRYQRDTIEAGRVAAERGAVVVVFTDPWLSPAVEYGRHVLISHADSASPFDSMLGAFALAEVIAAKVVAALGDAGHRARRRARDHARGRARPGRWPAGEQGRYR